MKNKFTVTSERADSYKGKSGVVNQRILCLMDSDSGQTMLNTVDYVLAESETARYPVGSLTGQVIEVSWNNLRANFGGRFRLESIKDGGIPASVLPNPKK